MPWGLKRYYEEEKISTERWLRVGRVSAKIPTSRKNARNGAPSQLSTSAMP